MAWDKSWLVFVIESIADWFDFVPFSSCCPLELATDSSWGDIELISNSTEGSLSHFCAI